MKFNGEIFCKNCDDFFPLIEKMAGHICSNCRTILVHSFERNGLEVGDDVIVTSPGATYDMYKVFADLYQLGDRWRNGDLPRQGTVNRILLIAPHDVHSTQLCYVIENIQNGKRYIIGSKGLQKTCSSKFKLEEELFEI